MFVWIDKTFEDMRYMKTWNFKKMKVKFKEDSAKIKLLLGISNQTIHTWGTQVLDESNASLHFNLW